MPPRKRKQQGAAEQTTDAAECAEPQAQPDRHEIARQVQLKLQALDEAGEPAAAGGTG